MFKTIKRLLRMIDNVVLKSTLWYMMCSLISSGVSFITAPVFTRLLTKEVYGEYNNFTTWYGLLACVITLNLYASIMRARYEYSNEFDGFVKTILILGMVSSVSLGAIIIVLNIFFPNILNMSQEYVFLMVLAIAFSPAITVFQSIQRLSYKYKLYVIVTVGSVVVTAICAIVCVCVLSDKMTARVIGGYLPGLIINIFIFMHYMSKRQVIKASYCRYALKISLPFIPHLLAGSVLIGADRIVITSIRGTVDNAIYSVAVNCVSLLSVFTTSISAAILPWIIERIRDKRYSDIRYTTAKIVILFAIVCGFFVLFSREIVLFIGGNEYYESINSVFPLVLGTYLQFVYTFFVNIEQYEKNTLPMAVATMIAAVVNLFLNYMLIPIYGFSAAGWTTFISYFILLILHYLIVLKMKMADIYSIEIMLLSVIIIIVCDFFVYTYICWKVIGVLLLLGCCLIMGKDFLLNQKNGNE